MKSKFKIYGIYMLVYLLLLPTLVTLGAIACINHLGSDGYFTNETIANIANIGAAGVSIFLITYIIWANKSIKLIPSFASPLNYGPCAVMAAALSFISAHLIIESKILTESFNGFTLAVGILALLSVLYFGMSAIFVRRRSIMRSDLGIIVLIFLCAYIAYIFFDIATPINAPIKTTTMMAFLAFALFFLYETRLSLGREKWHYYVAFAFISSLISAYASIPALIVYIIDGREIGISIYETVLVFAFFIFSTFKLFLVGELVPERGSKVVNKLIASADERINELKPEEPVAEEAEEIDENQFSILDGENDGESEEEAASDSSYEADNNDNAGILPEDEAIPASESENSAEDDTRVTQNEEENAQIGILNNDDESATDKTDTASEDDTAVANERTIDTAENIQKNDTRVTFSGEKDSIDQ